MKNNNRSKNCSKLMAWRALNHPRTMGILTRTGTESANVERKQLADLRYQPSLHR